MEVQDTRAVSGHKPDAPEVEINGTVAGFVPAFDRVLVKRLPKPSESINGIIRPEIAQEQAARGFVIAVGESAHPTAPGGRSCQLQQIRRGKALRRRGRGRIRAGVERGHSRVARCSLKSSADDALMPSRNC